MRPVGKHRLLRCEVASDVAADLKTAQDVYGSNLLPHTADEFIESSHAIGINTLRVTVPADWDGSTGSGGSGGSRYVSLVPEPFIAA